MTDRFDNPSGADSGGATGAPADAAPSNWVDMYAPAPTQPFLRLMRADRPIGTWLLFIPCIWGASLALAKGDASTGSFVAHIFLFAVGAYVMRGAGCAYNDIVDRNIDRRVARTKSRPVASGAVTLPQAWAFLTSLCLIGLGVLLQFNAFAIGIGLLSLVLIAAYPFMKRVTWWPQAWLGLTFNIGVLIGYSASVGHLSLGAIMLYVAGIAWTLGYDTIYAHQDVEDDALIGVKSSARALGDRTRPALAAFYFLTVAFAVAAVVTEGGSLWVAAAFAPVALHFAWQVRKFDSTDPVGLLTLFKSNRDAGLLMIAPLLLAAIVGRA